MRIGAINSNLFQDDDYKLGSLTHADGRVRAKAVAHHLRVHRGDARDRVDRPEDLAARRHQLRRARTRCAGGRTGWPTRCSRSTRRWTTTSGCCWSTSSSSRTSTRWTSRTGAPRCLHCLALGERAQVVLDTGHHAPGTNIEFIVMQLLRQNRLGAFDFNSRFYADDDLMVGSADPFQLFRIMVEIVSVDAHRPASGVNFMLDQCHNIEDEDPRPDPLGAQRAAGAGQGVARGRRRARRGPAGRRRAGRERRADGRLRHRRAGRCWPTGARRAACPATRWPPTGTPGTARRSSPTGSAAPRPAGTDGAFAVTDHPTVDELIARSNRLGADPRNTNYAGRQHLGEGHRDRPGHR